MTDFLNKCKNLDKIIFKNEVYSYGYERKKRVLKFIQDLPYTQIEFHCFIDEIAAEDIVRFFPSTLKSLKMKSVEWNKKFFQTILEKKIKLEHLTIGYEYKDKGYSKDRELMDFLKSFTSLKSFDICYMKIFNFECLENHQIEKIKVVLERSLLIEKGLSSFISKQKNLKVIEVDGIVQTLELMKIIGNSTIEGFLELLYSSSRNE